MKPASTWKVENQFEMCGVPGKIIALIMNHKLSVVTWLNVLYKSAVFLGLGEGVCVLTPLCAVFGCVCACVCLSLFVCAAAGGV